MWNFFGDPTKWNILLRSLVSTEAGSCEDWEQDCSTPRGQPCAVYGQIPRKAHHPSHSEVQHQEKPSVCGSRLAGCCGQQKAQALLDHQGVRHTSNPWQPLRFFKGTLWTEGSRTVDNWLLGGWGWIAKIGAMIMQIWWSHSNFKHSKPPGSQ